MPTLTLSQLSRVYGPYKAVDGLNLVIRDGEFISLLGPTGCGKTTALRMIAGFVTPSAGFVAVNGRVLSSPKGSVPPEQRAMAMLFQSIALWPHMSVADNVAYGLRQRQIPNDAMAQRISRALDLVGLRALADRLPIRLTPAQQQRAALARAIVIEPTLLLLDEAFSTLEPSARVELHAVVRTLHDRLGLTTVAVTGDAQEAMVMSGRIAVMNRGRVEQVDTPGALYMQPQSRFVATLMGRTNLLSGKRTGKRINFDAFGIDAGRLPGGASGDGVTVSIRPEHLRLVASDADVADDCLAIAGRITQRTFIGAHWDYIFAPNSSAPPLSVATPNTTILAAGQAAKLIIEPKYLMVVT